MSFLDLLDWQDRIDYGLNSSTGQQRHNFACECGGNCDLLLQSSRAEHRTNDVQAFAQDLIEVDVSSATGDATNENDPAPRRHRFKAGSEIRTSIQIENDVKSAAAGYVFGKDRKSL